MDRLRIGTFTPGGRFTPTLDINDGVVYTILRDTFKIKPPERRQQAAAITRRYGGSQIVGETHDNGELSLTTYVAPSVGTTDREDSAIANADVLITALESAVPDRLLEWRPDGATRSTYYELRGPGSWDPSYRWIEFQAQQCLQLAISVRTAPLAQGDPLDISDDFSVDSLSDYTFTAGAGTLSVSGGQLVPSSTAEKRLWHSVRGYRYEDVQATAKIVTGSSLGGLEFGVTIKRLDANNFLFGRIAFDGSILIGKNDAGVLSGLNSAAVSIATNTAYWVRTRIEGNVVTAEVFTSDPGPMSTPAQTVSHTLTGANATKFGQDVAGDVGLRIVTGHTSERYDDFKVRPYTYRNQTLPKTIQLSGPIPGNAPAKADIVITPSGGSSAPIWALLGWSRRPSTPVSGSVAPFGVLEGESGTLTTWTSQADSNYRGGNGAKATTSGAGTASAEFLVDPATLLADDFTAKEVDVEVWGRVELASTVISPTLTLSTRPDAGTSFGQERFSHEWGAAGKLVPVPTSGTQFRFTKLGILTMYVDPAQSLRWKLRVAAAWAAGSSGTLGLDYIIPVLARQRAGSPSGKPNDSTYPKFVASTAETQRLIRSDLSGMTALPPNNLHPDQGLGGQLIELSPGNVDLLVKLGSLVPDDTTAAAGTEQLAHSATVQVRVIPRYFLGRGV